MSANDFHKYINNEVKILEEYRCYIQTNAKVINSTLSRKAYRYYVSFVCEVDLNIPSGEYKEGIGIDLGVKDLVICSQKSYL